MYFLREGWILDPQVHRLRRYRRWKFPSFRRIRWTSDPEVVGCSLGAMLLVDSGYMFWVLRDGGTRTLRSILSSILW